MTVRHLLAALLIATSEGGVLLARAERDLAVFDAVAAEAIADDRGRGRAPTVMTPSPVPGAAVTQFAVLDALLAGAYESGMRVAEARSIGDFGLGCVDHLGGEVVILDGAAIECTLSTARPSPWATTRSCRSRSCAGSPTSRRSA